MPGPPLCHLNPSLLCPGASCIQTRWTTPGGPTAWTPSSRRYKGLAQLVWGPQPYRLGPGGQSVSRVCVLGGTHEAGL